MAGAIDFYFDFSSPYGYIASTRIDAIGARHGREVAWRPFLLGAAFKITGQKPLTELPMRGGYALHDFARSARAAGVAFVMPTPFPFFALGATRAFYWIAERDRRQAKRFAKAVYDAAFARAQDVTGSEAVLALAEAMGVDRDGLAEALDSPEVKARLKTEVDEALAKGVFGSPFVIVDGEPFWGNDRLDDVENWLATGGW